MERDKFKGGINFEVTDTVLLEIDARLAGKHEELAIDSREFDIDFGAALDDAGKPAAE